MQKNIILSIVISVALIGVAVYFISDKKPSFNSEGQTENVEIRDGVQYVTVNAKGGYSPRVSEIKANIPTKLIVKTNGTYDCSLSLVIRSLNFQKILQQTGEEIINVGTPKSGDKIQGVCGMGMYSFLINAS